MSLHCFGRSNGGRANGLTYCLDKRDHKAHDIGVEPVEVEAIEPGPILDVGGYLACGCLGSQREHTCRDL